MTSLRGLKTTDKIMGAARIRCEAEANKLLGQPDHAMAAEVAHADKVEAGLHTVRGPGELEPGAGGEIVPHADGFTLAAHYKNTVQAPSYVTAEASRARLDLADAAGVLTSALDIADTIEARDSTERNLAAQMALLHKLVMKAGILAISGLERAESCILAKDREIYTIQSNRMVNTVARASAEYQGAMLTLQRVRSGGKQNITVTHIQNTQVNDGGKAVITGGAVDGPDTTGGETRL
jgi:hypothetical protein